MDQDQVKIIRRRITRYSCGCTTTRVEVQHQIRDNIPICDGHHYPVELEQETTEFQEIDNWEIDRLQASPLAELESQQD